VLCCAVHVVALRRGALSVVTHTPTRFVCAFLPRPAHSHGRSGAAMSAAAFCLLVMNIVASPKPKFAQLASSVFGLFYCGAWGAHCAGPPLRVQRGAACVHACLVAACLPVACAGVLGLTG
jgi:hypothetical protein